MFKKINKPLIITILLFSIASIAFFFWKQKSEVTISVLDAIPTTSALVFESQSTSPIWEKLTQNTSFWPILSKIDRIKDINNQMQWLDSIFVNKPELKSLLSQRPMALALHETNDGLSFLFVVAIKNDFPEYELESTLNNLYSGRFTIIEQNNSKKNAYLLVDSKTKESYAFAYEKGLFIGSFSKELLDLSIKQIDNPANLSSTASFTKVKKTCGSSVDGNLYINFDTFSNVISSYSSDEYKDTLSAFFENFGGFSALDVMVRQKEIVLNGYSESSDSLSFLNHLLGHNALKNTLINILPYSTKIMLHFGISSFEEYWLETNDLEPIVNLEKKYGINVYQDLIPYLSGELALCITDSQEDAIFVAANNNSAKIKSFLDNLSSKVGVSSNETIENVIIKELKIKNFIPTVFGNCFSDISRFNYALVDQYLLVANDKSTLERMIRFYHSGRTLDMNENFKSFQNNLSETANITLFVNIRDNLNLLNKYISPQFLYHLNRNQSVVNEFEALSIQFTSMNDLIYTTAYINHNPDYKEESLVVWKLNLDAPISGKPHIVEDYLTKKYNVIVFDTENKMYLISPDGEIYWKKQFSQPPISDVFVVDFFKNGKTQYLFNSENYLQLIDRNGNNVKGYPVKLRSNATNGISVFDYNNRKDYRILISCADKLTYNYEISGREVDGWQRPRSMDIVSKPIERLIAADKDLIIITDINGGVKIVDRRGQIRIQPIGKIEKSNHTDFYVNKTNSKGLILTSDKTGKLLYISGSGQMSTTDFGNYSPDHFFLYEDFNQDKTMDFIYLDGNKLRIFDRLKKDLYSQTFKEEIVTRPVFFNITKNKRLLGIVSESAQEIYLIDKNGKMIVSSGLSGETPFAVGSLQNNDEINLVTGIENTVFNYLIY